MTRRHESGHETVNLNRNESGARASYNGAHRGSGWRTRESASVDENGNLRGEVSGNVRGVIAAGTDGEVGARVNVDGNWGVNGRVSHAHADASRWWM